MPDPNLNSDLDPKLTKSYPDSTTTKKKIFGSTALALGREMERGMWTDTVHLFREYSIPTQ
jgi:hypothetical protein